MEAKVKKEYIEKSKINNLLKEFYNQSKNNQNFYNLYNVIFSDENIELTYNILKEENIGKMQAPDKTSIESLKELSIIEITNQVKEKVIKYRPQPARLFDIKLLTEKETRYATVGNIWDRIIQQCILQVLEPICEAKYHNHSYAFRPYRSPSNALSRVVSLINLSKHYYCVKIDLTNLFKNINHSKLKKQLWSLGIKDKTLLSILSKILKTEITNYKLIGKEVFQAGLLSPLFYSIYLNELDWWVSNQWETYKPKKAKSKGWLGYAKKYTNYFQQLSIL